MKKVFYITLGVVFLAACQSKQQEPEVKTAPALEQQATASNKPKIELASNEDPVCKMSVADEVGDTTLYNGKVYGFCGSGCKEEFVANPTAYITN